jgi:hypothetical protein
LLREKQLIDHVKVYSSAAYWERRASAQAALAEYGIRMSGEPDSMFNIKEKHVAV